MKKCFKWVLFPLLLLSLVSCSTTLKNDTEENGKTEVIKLEATPKESLGKIKFKFYNQTINLNSFTFYKLEGPVTDLVVADTINKENDYNILDIKINKNMPTHMGNTKIHIFHNDMYEIKLNLSDDQIASLKPKKISRDENDKLYDSLLGSDIKANTIMNEIYTGIRK